MLDPALELFPLASLKNKNSPLLSDSEQIQESFCNLPRRINLVKTSPNKNPGRESLEATSPSYLELTHSWFCTLTHPKKPRAQTGVGFYHRGNPSWAQRTLNAKQVITAKTS